jgi:cytochrome c-type biogenesis protein CcmF
VADLGRGLTFLALAVAVYGVAASLYGGLAHRPDWVTSGRRAAYALAGLTTGAFVVLEIAFLRSDFGFAVVQSHSSTTTPTFYKAAAAWSSQEGSLLLWLWLLSMWSALVLFLTRHRMRDVQPYAIAVLLGFATFFGALLVFAASPFDTLGIAPREGAGLNPLLRHPSMMIHPPMLYSGYTLWAVPFAFAVGALIVRRVDAEWIVATRRFALGAWLFLGIGILLGARWSYTELGWGGYWGWDPVENASLLPWLTGTAFLHSIMVQEKRGMLKTWNASLILGTGTLAILGTFLVRSGVLDSIHAFTGSSLGIPFVALIGTMILGSTILVVTRRATLRTEHHLDSLLSRESMFLGNNLVLVSLAFVVFLGTFWPLITEALGNKRSLGPPWFDLYTVPLAIVLVFLSGVAPIIAWRRATVANLRRNFTAPTVVAVVTLAVLLPFGVADRPWAMLMFAVGAFVVGTVVQEFVRGAKARRAMTGEDPARAMVTLVRRNRRRYGGYVVHLGMAVLFIGVAASSAFQHKREARIVPGQSVKIGNGYLMRYEKATSRLVLSRGDVERIDFGARLTLFKDGKRVRTLAPQRGYYPVTGGGTAVGALGTYFEGEQTSEVSLMAGLRRDVWAAVTPDTSRLVAVVRRGDAVFAKARGSLPEDQYATALAQAIAGLVDNYEAKAPPATFVFIVSPMVTWIWLGAIVTFLGGLICIWPTGDLARRRATAGYAAKVARDLGRA